MHTFKLAHTNLFAHMHKRMHAFTLTHYISMSGCAGAVVISGPGAAFRQWTAATVLAAAQHNHIRVFDERMTATTRAVRMAVEEEKSVRHHSTTDC